VAVCGAPALRRLAGGPRTVMTATNLGRFNERALQRLRS